LQAVDSLVDKSKIQFQLRQIAAQTGMYYSYAVADTSENGTQGVGILSNWPFEKTQVIIGLPRNPRFGSRNTVVRIDQAVEIGYLPVLQSRLEYASVMDRALQAAYINQMLVNSVQPVLLGMDMGARPNEQPYFSFRKKWQDAAQGRKCRPGMKAYRATGSITFLHCSIIEFGSKITRWYQELSGLFLTTIPYRPPLNFGRK
jgi:endonuclease/exonuclease/phosphatase family metal-dependent hydrolase